MEEKLVIVESPSKRGSIQKYLGKGYKVLASKGHLIDLPKKEIGVDVDDKFKAKYIVTKRTVLQDLKKAFAGKSGLVLAVDPDREGEAIGWHVAQRLGVVNKNGVVKKGMSLERIVFGEITEEAVKAAIMKPRQIDMDLVNAQQTRRILDRLVGYKLSPLLWKKVRYGLSAGRVQSVALKLVVDREREREAFKKEEYWEVKAYLSEKDQSRCKTVIQKYEEEIEIDERFIGFDLLKYKNKKPDLKNEADIKNLLNGLTGHKWHVKDIESKDLVRSGPAPLKTSTLQQMAANVLGYSPKKTMQIAQKLYEAGHITYMRTDSITLSDKAINEARKYINKKFGSEYLPEVPKRYKTKSKVAQEAHEAIRPTNFNEDGAKLNDGSLVKLYKLIWQRTLASQMSDARLEGKNIYIVVGDCEFVAKGVRLVFDGFYKVLGVGAKESILPEIQENQELYPAILVGSQSFTQPKSRYTEATLIKDLEKYGVGRPSTYSAIISTISQRSYIQKEGRYIYPTDLGFVVTRFLEENFNGIVDIQFTANLEDDLDKIANGKKDWIELLSNFYGSFEKHLGKIDKVIDRGEYTILGEAPKGFKCPECKGKMAIKLGKYGRFYSCKKWPDCKGMVGIEDEELKNLEKWVRTDEFLKNYEQSPRTEDGRAYVFKKGRFGYFWAHPDYPKVKDARPIQYSKKTIKAIYGSTPKTKNGKNMVLRRGRFGEFWAHPDYPKTKEIVSLNKKEIGKKKKDLNLPI